jgi:hypothetical protein
MIALSLPLDIRHDADHVVIYGRDGLNLALPISPEQADELGWQLQQAADAARRAIAASPGAHGEGETDFAAELGPHEHQL